MDNTFIAKRSFCVLSGLSGTVGVVLLMVSFGIAIPPHFRATIRFPRPFLRHVA